MLPAHLHQPTAQSQQERILYVRLPCNPIFPIGAIYLADHVHKLFPTIEQRIFDLGAVPPLDYKIALDACIDQFRPSLVVFSWRDGGVFERNFDDVHK